MTKSLLSIVILCTISLWSTGQVNRDIEGILSSPEFTPGQISLSVMRMNGSEFLGKHQHNRLIPASTYKLITTLAAMELLGFEYRYETKLGYRGELIEDGTLEGDIVIIGSGDPSLGSDKTVGSMNLEDLTQKFIEKIKNAGIRCVEGNILIDTRIFNQHMVHDSWAWDDLTNYYACGTSGFNIHENYYKLYFSRSSIPGKPTQVVRMDPLIPNMEFENEVVTGAVGSGDNAYLFGNPYSDNRQIRGTIPPGSGEFTIKGAIPDPAFFYRSHLINELEKYGITVIEDSNNQRLKERRDVRIIYSHLSPELPDLVKTALEESNNMYCDTFLKTLSAKNSPGASFQDGVEAILQFLDANSLDRRLYALHDGSGLSTRNRLSAFQLNKFLILLAKKWGVEKVIRHLPQAGVSRGMMGLLESKKYQKRFWLKSGSMSGVLGYSGFVKSENGEYLALSVLVNGHTVSNTRVRYRLEHLFEAIYLQLNE